MIDDLDAHDCHLLLTHPYLEEILTNINSLKKLYCIPEYITTNYIQKSLIWWNEVYLKKHQIKTYSLFTLF